MWAPAGPCIILSLESLAGWRLLANLLEEGQMPRSAAAFALQVRWNQNGNWLLSASRDQQIAVRSAL